MFILKAAVAVIVLGVVGGWSGIGVNAQTCGGGDVCYSAVTIQSYPRCIWDFAFNVCQPDWLGGGTFDYSCFNEPNCRTVSDHICSSNDAGLCTSKTDPASCAAAISGYTDAQCSNSGCCFPPVPSPVPPPPTNTPPAGCVPGSCDTAGCSTTACGAGCGWDGCGTCSTGTQGCAVPTNTPAPTPGVPGTPVLRVTLLMYV